MMYKNLVIIGTSHIARESAKEVRDFITKNNPAVVAVELDMGRARALMSGQDTGRFDLRGIRRVGLNGFIFGMIGSWASKKIGQLVGATPGIEMKTALLEAKKNKSQIALIDQEIEVTLRRFSQEITFREKFKFVIDLIKGLIFPKREIKKLGIKELDLSRVPEDKLIRKLIARVKKDYPSIYKVLIKERNDIMAAKLLYIMKARPDDLILAVMGAGHKEEIIKIIKRKLKDNQLMDEGKNRASYTFSYNTNHE